MNPITNFTANKSAKKSKISNGVKPIKILVTAGPTKEPIDPVRFISNYSTGAMGYAIAAAAKKRKHKVLLISGPTNILSPEGIKVSNVTTADEMFAAVKREIKNVDCVIMSAAVSDYKPKTYNKRKLKRTNRIDNIAVTKNPDILLWLGKHKKNKLLVGFCMETENLLQNAKRKLQKKSLDLIVANKIDKEKSAFGKGKTSVLLVESKQPPIQIKNSTKSKIAGILLDKIEQLWYNKNLIKAV